MKEEKRYIEVKSCLGCPYGFIWLTFVSCKLIDERRTRDTDGIPDWCPLPILEQIKEET